MKVTLSGYTIPNEDYYRFSITSNGSDGEGVSIQSFNISPLKIVGTKIPFIIRVKDRYNFTIKNINNITDISITLLSGQSTVDNSFYEIVDISNSLSSLGNVGIYRGYLKFFKPIDNIFINVSGNVLDYVNKMWSAYNQH